MAPSIKVIFKWPKFLAMACLLVLFFCAPVAGTVVLKPGLIFTSSTLFQNTSSTPPDPDLAVGPTQFVEFINGRFTVYGKNATRLQTMTDSNFWFRSGVVLPQGWAIADPRIIYDPTVQRWFASQVDFDPTLLINTNHFLLAVSPSADPTQPWKGFSIASDPGGNNFADYPTLGIDSQGVYLAGDLFDTNGNAVGSSLLSLPKAGLLASPPDISKRTWFGVLNYASRGQILQPSVNLDGSTGEVVLGGGGLGFDYNIGDFVTNTTLIGFSVRNAAGPGAATLSSSTIIPVPDFTAPFDPAQPDGSVNLDDGDARLSSFVRRVGSDLLVVHNTQFKGHAAIRWYRIEAATYTLLESGTISDPNLDLFDGSIDGNTNGTVVIAFNGASTNSFVSCYAVAGEIINGVTTFGNLQLLKAGVASYQNTVAGGFSRWGDYTTTCVDPADPTHFWTVQMYPASASTWSTEIIQLQTSPLRFSIAPSGTNVLVSWSSLGSNLQLQSTSTLSSGSLWSPVSQTPTTNGDLITVLIPALGDQQFFRLTQGP